MNCKFRVNGETEGAGCPPRRRKRIDYTNRREFVIMNKYIFLQGAPRGEGIQKIHTEELQKQQKGDIL